MKNSIFKKMGLDVVAYEGGVYHLRRGDGQGTPSGDVVGLLFSETPLTVESGNVKLFLQEAGEGVPPARIVYHWQTLDARRFEETGLDPVVLTLDAESIAGPLQTQNYTRPDGARLRHGVRLATGEVVCYN